jgi:3-oxoacyl-[acyl-carrier protein] reductase
MSTKLNDRVAIVTGGGSGIGEAICRRFDAEGARVAVLDINAAAAEQVAGSLEHDAMTIEVDVRDSGAVERAVDAVVEQFGQLDVVVNNAGIAGGDEAVRAGERLAQRVREAASGKVETQMEATIDLTDDQFRLMIETHLFGTFNCTRAALRHMTARGNGVIVNIGSRCGQEGCMMLPHYSAAKGAIHAFTRAVAQDVAAQGVRVNAVAPGFVETPINDFLPEEAIASAVAATPIERVGTAAEIAAVTLFLASDDASFMYGQVLGPNGGLNTSPI